MLTVYVVLLGLNVFFLVGHIARWIMGRRKSPAHHRHIPWVWPKGTGRYRD